jgi:hypothetical protein
MDASWMQSGHAIRLAVLPVLWVNAARLNCNFTKEIKDLDYDYYSQLQHPDTGLRSKFDFKIKLWLSSFYKILSMNTLKVPFRYSISIQTPLGKGSFPHLGLSMASKSPHKSLPLTIDHPR